MARPYKQGLDYFPLDVNIFRDEKISILLEESGPLAVYVYIRILALVFENGYYLEMTLDHLARIIRRESGSRWSKYEKVKQMVNACVECGLLNSRLANQGVITSVAIQEQFLRSTQRRKSVDTSKYWLLDDTHSKDEPSLSVSENEGELTESIVNVDNNSINVDNNSQSKSKSEIDKKINEDKRAFGEPKLHFITHALIKANFIESDDLSIGDFNILANKLVEEHGFDLVLSVTNYIVKFSKKEHIEIDNPFEYFKASAKRELDFQSYKDTKFLYKHLEDYERIILKAVRGEPRTKGYDFAEMYPKGTYILKMAGHISVMIDGVIYDTWDCRYRTVYTAWKVN